MASTHMHRHVKAPRASVYRALVNRGAVAQWMVPTGMTSHVHDFDARVGGSFRISLTYDSEKTTGKTTAQTDTYHGKFVELVPGERVVETMEFETDDPAMRGEMTVTFTLREANGGTDARSKAQVGQSGRPDMSVYVDEPIWRWRGLSWAHLLADDLDELHGFAHRLGIHRFSFQAPPKTSSPHYDITAFERQRALAYGAVACSRTEIVAIIHRNRQGDRWSRDRQAP